MLKYFLNGWTRALLDMTDGRVCPSITVTSLSSGDKQGAALIRLEKLKTKKITIHIPLPVLAMDL
jgi:hypothetical protein